MKIRVFQTGDMESVIRLWDACGLTRSWNNPRRDIERKISFQPELFFVGELDGKVMSSAMFGYDGHRGWLYYFAVLPVFQGHGHARALLEQGEAALIKLGCPKINFQVRSENDKAIAYYKAAGYTEDPVLSFGKRLIPDN